MNPTPDYADIAARANASGIMVTAAGVEEIAGMLGVIDPHQVASRAGELVSQHAARLGMDTFAADVLERAIRDLPKKLARP